MGSLREQKPQGGLSRRRRVGREPTVAALGRQRGEHSNRNRREPSKLRLDVEKRWEGGSPARQECRHGAAVQASWVSARAAFWERPRSAGFYPQIPESSQVPFIPSNCLSYYEGM